jgi:hypothetical protein
MSDPRYPPNWPEVAQQVKEAAGWRCVRCGHRNESPNERLRCDGYCDHDRHPEKFVRLSHAQDGRYVSRLYCAEAQRQRVLTVHHLDGRKDNLAWWNLVALCQVCHLIIQAKVDLNRPWTMFEHSDWFKPYAAGWYAKRYLDQDLTRDETMTRLDELLALERIGNA